VCTVFADSAKSNKSNSLFSGTSPACNGLQKQELSQKKAFITSTLLHALMRKSLKNPFVSFSWFPEGTIYRNNNFLLI
jgi:hypothetical protein